MQFQQDWPKDETITALLNFCRKTEKFRSTELYDAPLEGSTIFRLAELKYASFSRTGRNTKKLRRSNLFPLTRMGS